MLVLCVLSCHTMYSVSKFGTHDPLSKQLNTALVGHCVRGSLHASQISHLLV